MFVITIYIGRNKGCIVTCVYGIESDVEIYVTLMNGWVGGWMGGWIDGWMDRDG